MRKILSYILMIMLVGLFGTPASTVWAQRGDNLLVHIKTSLSEDDAQICVAYNMIWAALAEGKRVSVLIDASAVNTYKKGWRGKDGLEAYKLPKTLKHELSGQLGLDKEKVPATYGEYLTLLHEKGAKFYINGAMLVVSGISSEFGDLSKISVDFFEPVNLKEMLRLFEDADTILAY